MEKTKTNLCCAFLLLLECGDGKHSHLTCRPKSCLADDPMLDNEHAIDYCLGDFEHCKYYPRQG